MAHVIVEIPLDDQDAAYAHPLVVIYCRIRVGEHGVTYAATPGSRGLAQLELGCPTPGFL